MDCPKCESQKISKGLYCTRCGYIPDWRSLMKCLMAVAVLWYSVYQAGPHKGMTQYFIDSNQCYVSYMAARQGGNNPTSCREVR